MWLLEKQITSHRPTPGSGTKPSGTEATAPAPDKLGKRFSKTTTS